jgi:transcription antitermination factor NusG
MDKSGMKWMVVYTKPRWEKKVAEGLQKQGIETYCPISRELRQWTDRKKWVEVVIIPSYVFVRCNEKMRLEILQFPGVLNFVYWLRKPGIVRDEEMLALQKFIDAYGHEEMELVHLTPGSKVVVEGGPLNERSGIIVDVKKNNARIQLEGLGIAIVSRVRLKLQE